jgi:hypothetical protein
MTRMTPRFAPPNEACPGWPTGVFVRILLIAIALLLLASAHASPPGFPDTFYRDALARGAVVYRIVPDTSLLVVHVHRAGLLSPFGHEHVVSTRELAGYVLLPGRKEGRADIYFSAESLVVDDPAVREAAGLEGTLPPGDVRATRRNMLEDTLDAEQHPYVQLHIEGVPHDFGVPLPTVITLRGEQRRFEIPVAVGLSEAGLVVSGQFSLRQSDFGITPFSAFGGTLRVADRIVIEFEIHAVR